MDYTYLELSKEFLRFINPYKWRFILGSIFRLVGDIAWLYNAYATATIVTFVAKYHSGVSLDPLSHVFILWTCVIIVRHTFMFIAKYLCLGVGQNAALDIEAAALRHLSSLDIAWHERENAGSKIKRLQRGAKGAEDFTRAWVINIIEIAVNLIGMLFIISRFDMTLTFLIIVYLIIFYAVASLSRRRALRAGAEVNIKEEESSGFLYEIVNNIRSVKVLGMSEVLSQHFDEILDDLSEKTRLRRLWWNGSSYIRSLWGGLARVALAAFVIHGIIHGKYEIGFLVLFMAYFSSLTDSIMELSSVAQDLSAVRLNMGRLAEIFNEPANIEDEEDKVRFPKEWGEIRIENLSFTYGDNKVLSDISFTIKKGEKVGIIGLSGAGKSTLFKLLLKEYEDYTGNISIDEISLRTIARTSYLNHVTAVLQETEVFNMSLEDNVTIANPKISSDATLLEEALEISHVKDFVDKLPSGTKTLIGEKGVKLSGGEKQRLGIARAVFKNPEILFLDEATSHLDTESEKKIQDSLHRFFEDVTAVVIAHRLSTIREMDKIVVIENGTVLEMGSFDELFEKNGRFRELWDKQRL